MRARYRLASSSVAQPHVLFCEDANEETIEHPRTRVLTRSGSGESAMMLSRLVGTSVCLADTARGQGSDVEPMPCWGMGEA